MWIIASIHSIDNDSCAVRTVLYMVVLRVVVKIQLYCVC